LVRKTRRADATPADKVTRLRSELQGAKELATLVVSREVKKLELGKDSRSVLEARWRLVELKRKHPAFASAQDDALLMDPERTLAKRPKVGEQGYV
jgi:Trm5-related predicted tRNA methylase